MDTKRPGYGTSSPSSVDNDQGKSPASQLPFFAPVHQITMSRPTGRSSDRLRMLMPAEQAAAEEERRAIMLDDMENDVDMGISSSKSAKAPTKRAQVISVACQHCQRQKSKCDGARPMCGPCQKRGRTDCTYELPRDQRRSIFMRERIEELKREKGDLKDIIRVICLAEDREAAIGTAQSLLETQFENIQEVAHLMRSNSPFATGSFAGSQGGREQEAMNLGAFESQGMSQNMTYMPHLPYTTAIHGDRFMQSQLSDGTLPPGGASTDGDYWPSLDSPYSARDLEFPSWPPPLPED